VCVCVCVCTSACVLDIINIVLVWPGTIKRHESYQEKLINTSPCYTNRDVAEQALGRDFIEMIGNRPEWLWQTIAQKELGWITRYGYRSNKDRSTIYQEYA